MGKVETYSRSKHGAQKVSPHFSVAEFACHDGSDTVKLSPDTVELLEKIRTYYNRKYSKASIVINSGYRTPSYNRSPAVRGARFSRHVVGDAADFVVRLKDRGIVPPSEVYDDINSGCVFGDHKGGLGRYRTFTHIDTRAKKARWRG